MTPRKTDVCAWVAACDKPTVGVAVSPYGDQLDLPKTVEVCGEHARVATAAGWVIDTGVSC